MKKKYLAAGLGLVAVLGAAWWTETRSRGAEKPANGEGTAGSRPLPRFVGKASCVECHKEQAGGWAGSDHDLAMQPAGDSTVLGNFDGDSLLHHGMVSRFYRRDGRFFVRTEGADGAMGEFEVKYTFGVRPLQQYLVEFPGGRMQALSTAWDAGKGRWFHLYPDRKTPHDDWLHWTRDGQNWNGMCADCHSTGLRRNYRPADGTFRTTWSEVNVSCEACHGPGSDHVDWARDGALVPKTSGSGKEYRYGLAADHMGKDSRAEIMACARCHARRTALRPDFGYSREFQDEYSPELLREGVYHADGQILDETFEFGSFLQSKMYHQGIRCSDCHDPHSLKVRAPGNQLCARCHEPARFDVQAHHRHAPGSPGSLCVDCHMPSKYYMQVDLRRDHSFRIPRPDLSVRFDTPNACNGCHADHPAAWAADWVVKWHGPDRKPHFSELLAQGRAGGPGADTALESLAGGSGHPAIARASALSLLSAYMGELARSSLARGAADPEPLVRQAAAAGLEELPAADRIPLLAPLLKDSIRAVRTAAANALVSASPLLPDTLRPDYQGALEEHRAALDANAYFPGGRFNIGQFHEKGGRPDSAIAAYAAALDLDNRFIPARINLAHLYNRLGRSPEAEAQFREAIRFNPEYADSYYSLGLLLAGRGVLDSARGMLERAAERTPGNARIHYNLGLILQKQGRVPGARKALEKALSLEAGNPDYLYALAWLLTTEGRRREAEALVARLAAAAPGHPGLPGLVQELRRVGP